MRDCIGKDNLYTLLPVLPDNALGGIPRKCITVKFFRNRLFYGIFALYPDTMLQLFLLPAHGFLCLLFFILCIGFLALWRKVFIRFYKFADAFLHHIPLQKDFCVWVSITALFQTDTLCVMVFMPFIAPDQCVGTASCAIFIFKERNIIFFIMPLHEILINPEMPMMKTAAPCQPGVYLVLCDKILIPHLHTVLCRIFSFFHT